MSTEELQVEGIDIEDFVLSEETEAPEEPQDPDIPSMLSPEWNDYVMAQFHKSELINGNPICVGLRRVGELLLGSILESGPHEVHPATDPNGPGRATVVYRIVFDWMNSGEIKVFSEVADVWHGNTDDLFCAHPVATASTRAEGRALRKALKLRNLAAEELSKKDIISIVQQTIPSKPTDGDWNPEEKISVQQTSFIDNKCRQLDIHVLQFINSGDQEYGSIQDITKEKASSMLIILNKYQNGGLEIPEDIKVYDENWRN